MSLATSLFAYLLSEKITKVINFLRKNGGSTPISIYEVFLYKGEIKDYKYLDYDFYNSIKEVLKQARKRVYRNIQSEMVFTYWQIGKMIVEKQGGEDRAKYGNGLIKELSIKLTNDLGRGFDERELRRMRQFYSVFPNRDTLCPELSWNHYISLFLKVNAVRAQLSCINMH